MEKKIIAQQHNKYTLLNPYNGGAQVLTYTPGQANQLVSPTSILKSNDKLRIFLTHPLQPN